MLISLLAALTFSKLFADPAATVWSRGYYESLRATLPAQKVRLMDRRSVAAEEAREGYLPPDTRDAIFRRVKLTKALAKYDEVDKDLLVLFVRDSDTSELKRIQRKYPNLSLGDLRRLRLEVGRAR